MGKQREYMMGRYEEAKALGLCTRCRINKVDFGIRCQSCKEKENAKVRQTYHSDPKKALTRNKAAYYKMRDKLYDKFGSRCNCCGEAEKAFLTIDHVNGGGRQERLARNLYGYKFMRSVLLDPDSSRYQLLCFNCNCVKGFRGECPHQSNPLTETFAVVA